MRTYKKRVALIIGVNRHKHHLLFSHFFSQPFFSKTWVIESSYPALWAYIMMRSSIHAPYLRFLMTPPLGSVGCDRMNGRRASLSNVSHHAPLYVMTDQLRMTSMGLSFYPHTHTLLFFLTYFLTLTFLLLLSLTPHHTASLYHVYHVSRESCK